MPHHERFDAKRWADEFTIERIVQDERANWERRAKADGERFEPDESTLAAVRAAALAGDVITGPRHLITAERLRQPHAKAGTLGRAVPTDAFVWALGEPATPSHTKIAGVPYRPADQPWPVGNNNEPSLFLAQLCFADSRDLVSAASKTPLPGDVLLIFSPSRETMFDDSERDPDALQFEWWPLGLNKLMQPDQMPDQRQGPQESILTPMHAHIHRTADYPDVAANHPLRTQHRQGEHLAILNATKIGGVNTAISDYDRLPGRFLAQIASIFTTHARHPLLNVASFDELASNEQDVLTFGDMGGLYLFVEQTGFFRKRSHLRWVVTSG